MSLATSDTNTSRTLSHAHPLDDFYAHAGLKLPRIEPTPGPSVPQPYRQLLVHDGDMTPTLEKFHQATIHLRVLKREQHGPHYFRQVVLLTDDTNKPVEFGAIKIYLDLFPAPAREDILGERLPLGTILAKYQIPHFSKPTAFLRIQSDGYINGALGLTREHVLYGRRNALRNGEQQVLAEIFEILPPETNT